MHRVTIRFPEEFIAFVQRKAKQRHVGEPQVWRELVAIGIQRDSDSEGLLKSVLNISVQALCVSRRLAGHVDESLVDLAREDAKRALEQLEIP